jgi:hypothetical protein
MRVVHRISRPLIAALGLFAASGAFAADDGTWSVRRFSGEVWTTSGDIQQASLKTDEVLKPGDTVRTGHNGRVLLVRGEESILIAPNSVVGIPAEKKEGLATTIKQQAGSILLEVEKKNVKHFAVETPYAAAVVKGTQFRVTVTASGTKVDVVRGQVEVADFKTGQIAQVMPGQHATAFASGEAGLVLGGSGAMQPIHQGQPRASSINRVPVPRNGLTAPVKPGPSSVQQRHASGGARAGVVRISSTLGEAKVNVHRATHGLARSTSPVAGARNAAIRETSTVWAASEPASSNAASSSANKGNGSVGGNGGSGGSAATGNSGAHALGGAATSGGNGNGNGQGNGNGHGNGVSVTFGGNGVAVGLPNGRGLHLGWGNGNGNGYGRGR